MSDFYKKFLLEDLRRTNPGLMRAAFLGAFGKHPGWDDHIEDLGLETEGLIFTKTLLYVQGIGGQINSGAWEKLDLAQQIPSFKHLFIWLRGNQCVVGRLWSSSDGKGRTHYPMVVCAHLAGLPAISALNLALPRLEKIEEACLLAKSAQDVRGVLNRYRAELQNVDTSILEPAFPPVTPETLNTFASAPELGLQREGWCRIVYQMQNQMASFARGQFNMKGDFSTLRPQEIRVPTCLPSAQALLVWSRFFRSQLDPMAPLLLIVPLEEHWLDVTAGEPTPNEFFCLKAGPKALPLATEVPYNLDDGMRAQARTLLEDFRRGQITTETSFLSQPDAAPSALKSTKEKLLKWFGGKSPLLL